MPRLALYVVFVLFALIFGAPAESFGQRWSWPEEPENLTVLEGVKGGELRPIMAGFTRALGVRCSYCHVGEEGQPLSSYDFASDENPNKDRAREMLRMVSDIRGHLQKIEASGASPVEVDCATCHRGRPRPMTLQDELHESYAQAGIDAAVTHYRSLRDEFYGRGAYDFGPGSLDAFGRMLLQDEDVDAALAVFALNTRENPESAQAWDGFGTACEQAGRTDEAIEHYRRAVKLDPRARHAASRLQELGAELKPSGDGAP